MAKIDLSMNYVLDNEGRGYSEPPEDDQPTKYGIIAADIAEHRHKMVSEISVQDVKDLTMKEATDIYWLQYWSRMKLDDVKDQSVATAIFDVGVNRGIFKGATYTQLALNNQGFYLNVDGKMGPRTVRAINDCKRLNFLTSFHGLVYEGYQSIVEHNPEDHKFLHGWLRRADRLLTLV